MLPSGAYAPRLPRSWSSVISLLASLGTLYIRLSSDLMPSL